MEALALLNPSVTLVLYQHYLVGIMHRFFIV